MKLFGELIGKSPDQTPVTRFLSSNGLIYIVVGVIMVAWPGSMQTVFGEIDFVGRESGLIQVLGLTVAIIGVLYLLGGRGHRPFPQQPCAGQGCRKTAKRKRQKIVAAQNQQGAEGAG